MRSSLGGTTSCAYAVNNNGQIVGSSKILGDSENHAFLYDNNQMLDLNDLLPTGSGWELKNASDINDSGQIVGNGIIAGEYHAFLMTPYSCSEHPAMDFNLDCKVDIADFAEFVSQWMTCNRVPQSTCWE